MCGPKQTRLGPTAGAGRSFASQHSKPDSFIHEESGLEPLGPDVSRPFNSFTAPVRLSDTGRVSGLRFPLSPKKEIQDDGFIPTLDPATSDRQNSDLSSVYNFGEDSPNGKLSDKISRGIQDNHRLMRENNNQYPASLDETFIDEALGSFDLKKSIKTFQDKYGAHDPNDPEAIGNDLRAAQLHNQKVRRDFIKDQHAQRERQRKHPSAYSEEGLSVEEIKGRKLTPTEQAEADRQRSEILEKRRQLAQDETLTGKEHNRTLEDDKELERLLVDVNKLAEKIVVPSILLGAETTKEAYRQTVVIVEDTVNNVIKAKNLFMLKKTLDGDLIVIPKPEVSKNPYARLLASVATMSIPGAAGARALKGLQTVQRLKKFGNATKIDDSLGTKIKRIGAKQSSEVAERVTGSIITTNERDPLIAYAFESQPEMKSEVMKYFEGKTTFDTLRAKLLKAGADGLSFKQVGLVLRAIKHMGPEKE